MTQTSDHNSGQTDQQPNAIEKATFFVDQLTAFFKSVHGLLVAVALVVVAGVALLSGDLNAIKELAGIETASTDFDCEDLDADVCEVLKNADID